MSFMTILHQCRRCGHSVRQTGIGCRWRRLASRSRGLVHHPHRRGTPWGRSCWWHRINCMSIRSATHRKRIRKFDQQGQTPGELRVCWWQGGTFHWDPCELWNSVAIVQCSVSDWEETGPEFSVSIVLSLNWNSRENHSRASSTLAGRWMHGSGRRPGAAAAATGVGEPGVGDGLPVR